MTGLYWSPGEAAVKTFSSATKSGSKGAETILKIEISVADHYALASLLTQLTEINREQAAEREASVPKKATKKKPLALPAPLLRIADMREDDL
ncbi:hypothetical protein ACQKGC_05740 [Allorhizobium pseudoryzae]|uniref:hypothetical protein n=1 Tax=Allorhizobium pseudoryzae TaxID=379684 RepID=UPI003D0207FE